MTGAQELWETLLGHGLGLVFGYPGGAVIPIYDVMPQDRIRHVLVRHEQAAAMAADGYARATGRLGVCLATSGPGAMNLLCGLSCSYLDSVPVLALTGQVPTGQLGRDAFQETDVFGATMPLTKHNYLVARAADLPRVLNEAVYLAQAGRKGPVLVDLPRDVMEGKVPAGAENGPRLPGYRPRLEGHPAQIARAAAVLAEAERPLMLVGGGVRWADASSHVRELAEVADIPVASTLMGLGCIPSDHPLYLGMVGMHGTVAANRAVGRCDVLLALGVRFSDRVTGKREEFASQARLIHVDVDPAELGKNVPAHVPIVGDLARVVPALKTKVPAARREAWRDELRGYPSGSGTDGAGVGVVRALAQVTGTLARRDELVLVTDVGQHQMWVAQHFPLYHPRTLLSSGGLGAMGYGLPAAIGAQVGCPDKTVVLVTGDGSFQMNLQELATVRQEGLPIKIVILDNGSLGMVRQWQEMFFDGNTVAVALDGPDYTLLAAAYGIPARRLDLIGVPDPVGPAAEAVARLLEQPGAALLHCRIAPTEKVLPMVPAGEPLARIIVSW